MSKLSIINYQLSVLVPATAALLSLSFSSFNLEFLAWFAFVPLFFALERKSGLQAFFISYTCGFLFFLFSMYWLVYVTPAGWFALSFYQALYFGIFGLFFAFTLRTTNYKLSLGKLGTSRRAIPNECGGQTTTNLILPSFWILLEYARANIAGGIGWNLLGYSQYKNIPLIQISDITGAYGVSFLIMLMNIAVYNTIKMAVNCYKNGSRFKMKGTSFKEDLKASPTIPTVIVLSLFLLVLLYGHHKSTVHGLQSTAQIKIKISVAQGNIPQKEKWDEGFKNKIIKTYEELTLMASKERPDLIIWPETAVPGFLNADRPLFEWVEGLVKKTRTPLLAGAPFICEEDTTWDYNSAVLFSKQADAEAIYNKLHLVMFGEFIPFEKSFPFLRNIFPITGSFIPGKEFTVFKSQVTSHKSQVNFSVLICFEDIFPGLVRQFVKNGAFFMVNMTNDAWFGKSCAAYQHAANSVFRAVENRRAFVRSANTGLSCFIDQYGNIYSRVSQNGMDLFVKGVKTDFLRIGKSRNTAFYTKYGDIFVLLCGLVLVMEFAITIRKNWGG